MHCSNFFTVPACLLLSVSAVFAADNVDPSEAPNGCVPPAGHTYVTWGCSLSIDAMRNLGEPVVIDPGSLHLLPERLGGVINGCDSATSSSQAFAVTDTVSMNVTLTTTASWDVLAVKASASLAVQVGLSKANTVTQTFNGTPRKITNCYLSQYEVLGKKVSQSADYTCTVSPGFANYLNPFAPSICRNPQYTSSYSGGTGTVVATLDSGLNNIPYNHPVDQPCPE